ncbi:MAG: hypothetical protein WBD34_10900 [Burkholderiaceae bacterium]
MLLTGLLSACGSEGVLPNPPGGNLTVPPDQLVFNGQQSGNFEIYTIGKSSAQATALTNDTGYDSWWPRISPDRSQILFYRTPAGAGSNYALSALWLMNADGSGAREIISQGQYGWTIQGHAEWSPDGQQLVMCGTANSTVHIFVTDAQGANPVQKTNDGTFNCDPAFSPDGAQIIFNRCTITGPCGDPTVKEDLEIYLMPSGGGTINSDAMTRLTNNNLADYDAYFSPDGSTIAWLQLISPTAWGGVGAWSVLAMNADGSNPRAVVNDGFINSKPAWALDGLSIYLHRLDGASNGKWGLFNVSANGSNLRRIEPLLQSNLEYPSN